MKLTLFEFYFHPSRRVRIVTLHLTPPLLAGRALSEDAELGKDPAAKVPLVLDCGFPLI